MSRKRADQAVVPTLKIFYEKYQIFFPVLTFPMRHQPMPSSSARVSEAGKNLEGKYGFMGWSTAWPALATQLRITAALLARCSCSPCPCLAWPSLVLVPASGSRLLANTVMRKRQQREARPSLCSLEVTILAETMSRDHSPGAHGTTPEPECNCFPRPRPQPSDLFRPSTTTGLGARPVWCSREVGA